MGVTATASDRNYMDMLNGTASSTNKTYNAVFTDKDSDDISVRDFFNMMITQLTNQDFMNPMDDTQYLSQMAQFSTMQEMMDLCQYSKQNYVMGMLGRNVTLTKNNIGGGTTEITGKVEKILLEDGDFKIYVNGTPYDYSKVTMITESTANSSENNNNNSDDNSEQKNK